MKFKGQGKINICGFEYKKNIADSRRGGGGGPSTQKTTVSAPGGGGRSSLMNPQTQNKNKLKKRITNKISDFVKLFISWYWTTA